MFRNGLAWLRRRPGRPEQVLELPGGVEQAPPTGFGQGLARRTLVTRLQSTFVMAGLVPLASSIESITSSVRSICVSGV